MQGPVAPLGMPAAPNFGITFSNFAPALNNPDVSVSNTTTGVAVASPPAAVSGNVGSVSQGGFGMGLGSIGAPGAGTADGFGAGATGIGGTLGGGDLGGGQGIGGLGFGMGTTGETGTATAGAPGAGVDGFGVGATSAVSPSMGYGYGSVSDVAQAQTDANIASGLNAAIAAVANDYADANSAAVAAATATATNE